MAASITGTFVIIDRASGPMRKMEAQARKTQAAVEGVGAAQDRAAGGGARRQRQVEEQNRALRNQERAAKQAGAGHDSYARSARNADRESRTLTHSLTRVGAAYSGLRAIMRVGLFAVLGTAISTLVQAVGALAGGLFALLPALAQSANAIAALPAAAGAAAQGIGTLMLALGGVGGALKEGIQQQQQAGKAATDSANQQRQAANSIRQAERSLFLANRSSLDAQKALTEARREAKRELIDLRYAAEGAALGQQRAALSLREAKDSLAKAATTPGTTELGMADAELSVREAQLAYRQSRTQNARARADRNRANAKGVNGSDRVVEARRGLEDAIYSQGEATRALTEAQRQANEQMSQGSSQAQQYAQAMKDLSPEARALVKQLISMRPELLNLRAAAGRELLPALGRSLTNGTKALPILRRQLRATGGAIGRNIEGMSQDLTSPARLNDLNTVLGHQAGLVDRAGRSLRYMVSALVDLIVAAQPFTDWLGDSLVHLSRWLAITSEVGRSTGSTAAKLDRARTVLERFGRITRNVWITLRELGRAAQPLGDRLWDGAERATAGWRQFMMSASGARQAQGWFNQLYEPLHELGGLTKDLAIAWAHVTVDDSFTDTVRELRSAMPNLERLLTSLSGLGPSVVRFLSELMRLFANMPISPLTLLVDALTKLLEILNSLIETVPGLGTALGALLTVAMVSRVGSYIGRLKMVQTLWTGIGGAMRGAAGAQAAVTAGEGGSLLAGLPGAAGRQRLGTAFRGGMKGAAARGGGAVAQRAAGARGALTAAGRIGMGATLAAASPYLAGAAAIGYGGYQLARPRTDPRTGLSQRSLGRSIDDRLGLGGFDNAMVQKVGNPIRSALGMREIDDSEHKIQKFGDTAGKLFDEAAKWKDDASLRKLARQADDLARSGAKGSGALRGFAVDARAAATDIKDNKIVADLQVQMTTMRNLSGNNIRSIIRQMRRLSPGARTAAARSMEAMAQQMEASGLLPRGSSRRLADRILKPLDGLAPRARRRVQLMIEAINAQINAYGGPGKFYDAIRKRSPLKPLEDLANDPRTRASTTRRVRTPRSIRALQREVGVPADGILGPATRAAAKQKGLVIKQVDQMASHARKSARDTRKAVGSAADGSANDVVGAERRKRRAVRDNNNAIESGSRKSWKDTRGAITGQASAAANEAGASFQKLRRDAVKNLVSMGVPRGEANKILNGGGSKTDLATPSGGYQTGGSPGHGPSSNMAYGGRYAGGGRIPGIGTHDSVALGGLAAPGELVVNRHTEKRVNQQLAMHGTSLGKEVAGETRPHSANLVRKPVDGRPMHGSLMGQFAKGGIVPVPGFPGERANQAILDEIAYTTSKFAIRLTDAFGAGHASPGHTQYGTSADFSGPDKNMDRAVAYWVKKGYRVGYDGRFGSQRWSGHGPSYVAGGNAHLHVDFGGASGHDKTPALGGADIGGAIGAMLAGGDGGVQAMKALKAPKSKLGGIPGAMSNRAGKLLARKMTSTINKRLGATGGAPGGNISLGGGAHGQQIFDFFKKAGFTDAQAAAFVGNFQQESGLNPGAVQKGGPGRGLAQWGGGRFSALQAFAAKRGKPWQDLETQLNFVMHELRGPEAGAYAAIKAAKSLGAAVNAVGSKYERFGIQGDRSGPAAAALRAYGGKNAARGGRVLPDGTVTVGDSLGVGTGQYLRGGPANSVVGRSSASGVAALHQMIARGGDPSKVLFDLGTNDGTARQLRRSITRARGMAPGAEFYVPTVRGPAARSKNAMLRRLADSGAIHLIDWASKSRGMVGGDGIHATARGYKARAGMIESAMSTPTDAAWGGWHKRGGSFSVDSPTVFGAGEGGMSENVTVTPKGSKQPGRSNKTVHIENMQIANHKDGDIEAQVKRELAKVSADLDLVDDEDD